MNKKKAIDVLKKVRESSTKRNFNQTVELIVTLRDIDLKKPDNHVDLFISLHHSHGKEIKICGLVGPEMKDKAKEAFDHIIEAQDFERYAKEKKKIKELAQECTYFVAQADLMKDVAKYFGRILGPINKMPNPKAGCVVPPNANLEVLKEKLNMLIRIYVKSAPHMQIAVGKEDMDDSIIADNVVTIYDQLIHHLPSEENNVKDAYLKLTMGPSIKVE